MDWLADGTDDEVNTQEHIMGVARSAGNSVRIH